MLTRICDICGEQENPMKNNSIIKFTAQGWLNSYKRNPARDFDICEECLKEINKRRTQNQEE